MMISAIGARLLVKLHLDVKGRSAGITCSVAQVCFDAQQLIVFGDAIGARQRSGLDLSGIGGDGEIGDERILCLTGSMRDDCRAAVCLRERDTVESLGER